VTALLVAFATPAIAEGRSTAGPDGSQPANACSQDPCNEPISPDVIERLDREKDITATPKPGAAVDNWFRFGGDARYRTYIEKHIRLNARNPRTRRRFWHRPRVRLWGEVRPIEDISIRSRILYGPRYFCEPDLPEQCIFNEAVVDQLHIQWRKAFGLPMTVTAGRQDIQLGDGWLIKEGTPLDGGRSFYFDAVRATLTDAASSSTLDLIYLQNHADSATYMRPFNDAHRDLIEQDEKGAIVYFSNEHFEKTQLESYVLYKNAEAVADSGDDADLYTFGGLAAGEAGPHWRYKFEVAYQFGNKNGESVDALGSNNRIAYCFGDPWQTKLHVDYEYRSGDRDADSNFDILWGRWTQFSNLYNYYLSVLEGQMAMSSNLHRFGPGIGFKPCKRLYLGANYHLLFRDHKSDNVDSSGQFRGQLITAKAQYDFTKDINLRLLYDLFLPDSFYGPLDSTASFLQVQLAIRW
jgi:hypothetical protein